MTYIGPRPQHSHDERANLGIGRRSLLERIRGFPLVASRVFAPPPVAMGQRSRPPNVAVRNHLTGGAVLSFGLVAFASIFAPAFTPIALPAALIVFMLAGFTAGIVDDSRK